MLTSPAAMLSAALAQGKIPARKPAPRRLVGILVDNAQCPRGALMAVTGGNHVKVGGAEEIVRTRTGVRAPNHAAFDRPPLAPVRPMLSACGR
jgi:hypothetical protein